MLGLDPAHTGGSHATGDERILRVVFEVSAAERAAVDVESRGQPDRHVVFFDFPGAGSADLLHEGGIPCAGEQGRARPCGRDDALAVPDAHTRRPVAGHGVRDAVIVDAAEAVGVRDAGVVCTADEVDEVRVVQLGEEGVERCLAARNVREQDEPLGALVLCAAELQIFKIPVCFFGEVGCILCRRGVVRYLEGFIAAVGAQALRELFRGDVGVELLHHRILFDRVGHGGGELTHGGAGVDGVVARFQHARRAADGTRVIKGRHVGDREGQAYEAALAGGEGLRLGEGGEHIFRLAELAGRGAEIGLHGLLARIGAPGIGHAQHQRDDALCLCGADVLEREGRVGETVAERIVDVCRRAGDRLEIAVAHINIIGVFGILLRFVEVSGGGVVREGRGKGIDQPAGGGHGAGEDIPLGIPALEPRLPCEQDGFDAVVLAEVGGIDHAADVEDEDRVRESRGHVGDELAFRRVQVEVAVAGFTLAVGTLTGEAADADDRGVGERRGILEHPVRQGCLGDAAGLCPAVVCVGDNAAVKIIQRLVDRDVTARGGIVHGVDEIVRVGGRHLAGAAAAADIVGAADTKERDACPGFEGEQFIIVFEEYHPLGRCTTGQRNVRGGRGDEPAVFTHRYAGLVKDALPFREFSHNRSLRCICNRTFVRRSRFRLATALRRGSLYHCYYIGYFFQSQGQFGFYYGRFCRFSAHSACVPGTCAAQRPVRAPRSFCGAGCRVGSEPPMPNKKGRHCRPFRVMGKTFGATDRVPLRHRPLREERVRCRSFHPSRRGGERRRSPHRGRRSVPGH